MGQVHGTLRSHAVVKKNGKLALESHLPPEVLEFDPNQSYMISYGIDLQTHPKFCQRSLTSIAGTDAEASTSMFRKIVGLPAANTVSFIASKDTAECTFKGIQQKFIKTANKVDTNGIFIFQFTGHGLCVDRYREWGLAPTDFDKTRDTFISGKTLAQWLQQSTFQGRYALFILDTCYAGGIGQDIVLESTEVQIPATGIYVMASCTAHESSLVLTALGKSIFNYFFSTAMFESYSQPGKLYLKELYETCDACCMAFSSLLLSYDAKKDTLSWKMMQPEFKQFHLPKYISSLFEQDDESTDSPPTGRFAFIMQLYDYNQHMRNNPLPKKCFTWLDMVSNPNAGALLELNKRGLLNGRILTAAVATMTYSCVSMYMACGDPPLQLHLPNFFIIILLHVVASIDKIHREVHLSLQDVRIALEYYMEPLDKQKHSLKMLLKLKERIVQEEEKDIGGEFTDSGEIQDPASLNATDSDELNVPSLCKWVPLDPMEDDFQ